MATLVVNPSFNSINTNRKFRPAAADLDVRFRDSDQSRMNCSKQRSRDRQAQRNLKHRMRAA